MSVKFNIRAKASAVGQFMWAAVATTVMVPFTAEAQEYCVACTGPDALYRCVIDGARPGVASSFQVLCISALAKEGPHASCAV